MLYLKSLSLIIETGIYSEEAFIKRNAVYYFAKSNREDTTRYTQGCLLFGWFVYNRKAFKATNNTCKVFN